MKFNVEKKLIQEALRKLSFFFTNSSADWANSLSLIVKSKGGVDALDLFVQTPTESFQTLVRLDSVDDFIDEEVVVDGLTLSEIVSKAKGIIEFSLDLEGGSLLVLSEDTEWVLPFLIRSMPRVKLESSPKVWSVEEMAAALEKVKMSLGLDIGRPYLMMANIEGGKLQACDGFKFQETRISNKELSLSIPSKSIGPILRLFSSSGWAGGEFSVYTGARITVFKGGSDKFCFFNPKTDFPDLTSMVINPIKAKVPSLITVDRKELIAKVEQVKLMSDMDRPQITIELGEGDLKLSCSGKAGFSAKSKLRANWTGGKKVLCFDTKSLLEILRSSHEDMIEVRISKDKKDDKGPIVVESEGIWSMLNQVRST